MKIGKRIKLLRKKAKMTQSQLATAAGISLRTVTGMESLNPLYEFTLYTLKKVLAIFNIVAEYKRTIVHLEQLRACDEALVAFKMAKPQSLFKMHYGPAQLPIHQVMQ